MATHFITALNGVITGQHCGDIGADFFGTPYYGHERIAIPAGAAVSAFDRVEFYGTGWKRKKDAELIDGGLLPMPEGYAREGDEFRPMTQEERVLAGLDKPPEGNKLENGKIVPMTMQEQAEAGQITQEEYDERIAAGNAAELSRRLAGLQTPEALALAETDEKYAAERKAKLAALLAVKKQPGWPLEAAWPEGHD